MSAKKKQSPKEKTKEPSKDIPNSAVTKEQVVKILQTVEDPELHVDIYTLELIYDIQILKEKIAITMTLTSPQCPAGDMILADMKQRLKKLKGIKDVDVKITFDPPWAPSEDLRALLGV